MAKGKELLIWGFFDFEIAIGAGCLCFCKSQNTAITKSSNPQVQIASGAAGCVFTNLKIPQSQNQAIHDNCFIFYTDRPFLSACPFYASYYFLGLSLNWDFLIYCLCPFLSTQ